MRVEYFKARKMKQLKVVFEEDPNYDYKDVSPETMEILPTDFST